MKDLIEKISVSEPNLKRALQWLSEEDNNQLEDYDLSNVVRFLLKRVIELEKMIGKK